MTDRIPARSPGPHPTPDQLYAARRGPRTAEAERHLAHAALCAVCSEELARQEAFDDPEPVSPRALEEAWDRFGRSAPAIRRPSRTGPALALAATLAAAAAGLGIWLNRAPVPEDVTRNGGETAGAWQPSGALAAPPADFVFPAPDGAPRRVMVFDGERSYSWTSPPAAGGRIAFPETERRKLRPGVEYFWTVVEDESGEAARSFRIRK
jgi:hypothetical protein